MTITTYGRQLLNYKINNIIKLQCRYELKGTKQVVNTSFHFKVTKWDNAISIEDFLTLIESVVISKFRALQGSNCRWASIKIKKVTDKEYVTCPLVGAYGLQTDTPIDKTKAFGFNLLYKSLTVRYDLRFVACVFKDYDRRDAQSLELDLLGKVHALERVLILEINLDGEHQLKYVKFSTRKNKSSIAEPLSISAAGFVERKQIAKAKKAD